MRVFIDPKVSMHPQFARSAVDHRVGAWSGFLALLQLTEFQVIDTMLKGPSRDQVVDQSSKT